MPRYLGDTVTWHHGAHTGESDYSGEPLVGFTDASLSGVAVAPRSSTESTTTGEATVLTGLTLYVRHQQLQVSPLDEFTVRGERYAVDGDAHAFDSPYAFAVNGTQIDLKRVH